MRRRLALALGTSLAVLLSPHGAVGQPPASAPAPSALAAPASVQLNVVIAQGKATVGDRIDAQVTLRVPAADLGGEPRFPDWTQGWGNAEVLEKGPVERKVNAGTAIYTQRLVLTAWQAGSVALPKLAVPVPLKTRTVEAVGPDNLSLTIASVLPPPQEGAKPPAAKPPAPPRPLPWGTPFLLTAAVLAAACLALAWQLSRRRQPAAAKPATPRLAPWDELATALGQLGAEPSPVALHTGLSWALRRYLGRRLDFPAAESTTSEIQRRLHGRHLPSGLVRQGVDLLRACDLVKFARYEVDPALSRQRLEVARQVGLDLEAHLRPPALPAPPVPPAPPVRPARLERAR